MSPDQNQHVYMGYIVYLDEMKIKRKCKRAEDHQITVP